jgi:hypothetical protein
MVSAALQFASDSNPPTTYPTPDAARLDMLNTLNWYEAHAEYAWPDFSAHGCDFTLAMRFRRALVGDVCVALIKAEKMRVEAGGGTLERGEKRGAGGEWRVEMMWIRCWWQIGSRRVMERKRKCKRGDESDTEDEEVKDGEELLVLAMRELVAQSGVDIARYFRGDNEVGGLADAVHDGLMEGWGGPVADHGEEVERKRSFWAKRKTREASVELGERMNERPGAKNVPVGHWGGLMLRGSNVARRRDIMRIL